MKKWIAHGIVLFDALLVGVLLAELVLTFDWQFFAALGLLFLAVTMLAASVLIGVLRQQRDFWRDAFGGLMDRKFGADKDTQWHLAQRLTIR